MPQNRIVTLLTSGAAAAAMLGGAAATIAMAPAQAATPLYAAIAYSPSTGHSNTVWNAASQADANVSALASCGVSDCKILAWSENGCVALASNAATTSGGVGPTAAAAAADALATNGGGEVWQVKCNG